MGGQTFFTFYNDVWRSCDGKGEVWKMVLEDAPWAPRAGLAAVVTKSGDIVVAGGCYNKNGNPAARSFLGDVWKSSDGGLTWVEKTPEAEWTARSGPTSGAVRARCMLPPGPAGRRLELRCQGGKEIIAKTKSCNNKAYWSLECTTTPLELLTQ